jgi:hypothetical protein
MIAGPIRHGPRAAAGSSLAGPIRHGPRASLINQDAGKHGKKTFLFVCLFVLRIWMAMVDD